MFMITIQRYPDTWTTPIWPTDIWSTDTWPTDIWPISAWGDIWPTDKMSHFNNSFIQFNNRISSIQRAVSDGNITKMWKESKEKFGQNCLLAKCPPCTYWPNVRWPSVRWPNVRWPSVRWPNGRWSNVPDSYPTPTQTLLNYVTDYYGYLFGLMRWLPLLVSKNLFGIICLRLFRPFLLVDPQYV